MLGVGAGKVADGAGNFVGGGAGWGSNFGYTARFRVAVGGGGEAEVAGFCGDAESVGFDGAFEGIMGVVGGDACAVGGFYESTTSVFV